MKTIWISKNRQVISDPRPIKREKEVGGDLKKYTDQR